MPFLREKDIIYAANAQDSCETDYKLNSADAVVVRKDPVTNDSGETIVDARFSLGCVR